MYAGYYPHPRPVDEVIELVGLAGEARRPGSSKLSGGQQRRLDVAIALAGDPELLFLDEPTTGFDPSARHEAWEVVKNLAALGKTVLLTTHYMDEAQYLADRVAVIAAGRIVAEGPPATLGGRGTRAGPHVRFRLPRAPTAACRTWPARRGPTASCELASENLTRPCTALTGWAIEHGIGLDDLEIVRPSLEDVYLALTGARGTAAGLRQGSPASRRDRRRRHEHGDHDGAADPLRQQDVLAQSCVGLLHLRVPADVPGHLHLAARSRHRADRSRLVNQSTYYVASMASFAVITACYNNIAIDVTFQRDSGVLKRTNGTPLPAPAFLGARIVHALFVAVLLVVITVAFGRLFYAADDPDRGHAAAVPRHAAGRRRPRSARSGSRSPR